MTETVTHSTLTRVAVCEGVTFILMLKVSFSGVDINCNYILRLLGVNLKDLVHSQSCNYFKFCTRNGEISTFLIFKILISHHNFSATII